MHLVRLAIADPGDARLTIKLGALQGWLGWDNELGETCARALDSVSGTYDSAAAAAVARICCLAPADDKQRLDRALALARKALEIDPYPQWSPFVHLALGMAEYRSGHWALADAALAAAINRASHNPCATGTAAFYRAMVLFRQGKEAEARQLAAEAASRMKPLPEDKKNPLAGDASPDDLILWLAHNEAKRLIKF
jgi:hypothetical protein